MIRSKRAVTAAPAVTATPAPAVTVPIYYIDAVTSRILARSSVQLQKSTRVYRSISMIPAGSSP